MQEIIKHLPGTFCWVDHATSDTEAAKKFYTALFDWVKHDIEVSEGMFYTMMNINGKSVAAISPLPQEMLKQNVPPYWLSYICVEDAAATVKKAKELGGSALMEAMDVMEEGVLALIIDPSGAILGLWQPKNHIGFSYKNEPNTFCWAEHASQSPEKSIPFYEQLFGWTAMTQNMGCMDYTVFSIGSEQICGMYKMPPDMAGIPPHWLPYFLLENIDNTLGKASSSGAEILFPKAFIEGVGYFSVVRDPLGGVFGLLQGEMK